MPLSADKLRDAFRSFDADGSGSVSDGELRETIDRFGAEVIPHLPGDDE